MELTFTTELLGGRTLTHYRF